MEGLRRLVVSALVFALIAAAQARAQGPARVPSPGASGAAIRSWFESFSSLFWDDYNDRNKLLDERCDCFDEAKQPRPQGADDRWPYSDAALNRNRVAQNDVIWNGDGVVSWFSVKKDIEGRLQCLQTCVCNKVAHTIYRVSWRDYRFYKNELRPGQCYCQPMFSIQAPQQPATLQYVSDSGVPRTDVTTLAWMPGRLAGRPVQLKSTDARFHLQATMSVTASSMVSSLIPVKYQINGSSSGDLVWESYAYTEGHRLFRLIKIPRRRRYFASLRNDNTATLRLTISPPAGLDAGLTTARILLRPRGIYFIDLPTLRLGPIGLDYFTISILNADGNEAEQRVVATYLPLRRN
jgi:hypothetical protein